AGAFDEIDDREWLLSQTRQWPENVEKLKIKMSCGHLKSRTVKAKEEDDDLEAMVEDTINEISCPHHPDAKPEDVKRLDPFYELARFYKDHDNGDEPTVYKEPSKAQLSDMELEALNVSLMEN